MIMTDPAEFCKQRSKLPTQVGSLSDRSTISTLGSFDPRRSSRILDSPSKDGSSGGSSGVQGDVRGSSPRDSFRYVRIWSPAG